tara:strand:+ start:10900 stop:11220 length:321 start_codon:yes stop_codon:yes gene_type:complete
MAESYRFSHGRLLLDDGSPDDPDIVQEFLSSNGTTVYTAIRWRQSQQCSCNCPGWAFRKSCKHSKKVAVAELNSYINRNPSLTHGTVSVEAGSRQARMITFNGNDN